MTLRQAELQGSNGEEEAGTSVHAGRCAWPPGPRTLSPRGYEAKIARLVSSHASAPLYADATSTSAPRLISFAANTRLSLATLGLCYVLAMLLAPWDGWLRTAEPFERGQHGWLLEDGSKLGLGQLMAKVVTR